MQPAISVIICTRNPNFSYFNRVLQALRAQTLPVAHWELIIIDNASDLQLAREVDLSWHSYSRCVREDELGILPARIRGIRESQGNLIVFVDDDNVLFENYLEKALEISQMFPMLGAWGGQLIPEFEAEPPTWTKPYWENLAIRQFDRDQWSNKPYEWETTPVSAGGCYRKEVAKKFVDLIQNDFHRPKLGQKGDKLLRCEDLDLAYTSSDLGFGMGLFKDLKLIHIMPSSRFEEQYLLSLIEGNAYSMIMLSFSRGCLPSLLNFRKRLRVNMPWLTHPKTWFLKGRARKFNQAVTRGRVTALREIIKLEQATEA